MIPIFNNQTKYDCEPRVEIVHASFFFEGVQHFIDHFKSQYKVSRMHSGVKFLKVEEIKDSAKRAKMCADSLQWCLTWINEIQSKPEIKDLMSCITTPTELRSIVVEFILWTTDRQSVATRTLLKPSSRAREEWNKDNRTTYDIKTLMFSYNWCSHTIKHHE
jgi:hypothetical protein